MGVFDIFKKRSKFVDDLFGELRYTKFKDSSNFFMMEKFTFKEDQSELVWMRTKMGQQMNRRIFLESSTKNTVKSRKV